MLVHVVDANRFKSSVADVQRDLRERRDASDFREYFRREMQARCRRCDRATMFRVNSLVSFAIGSRTSRTFDVRWQWCRSDLREGVVKRTFAMKSHAAKLSARFVKHFRDQPSFAKDGASAFLQPAAGTDECFPYLAFDLTDEKYLDLPAGLFATTDQTRGNHARVVYYNDIVRTKVLRELIEVRIGPLLLFTIEHEHSRSITLFERCLRDEVSRKVVIKL